MNSSFCDWLNFAALLMPENLEVIGMNGTSKKSVEFRSGEPASDFRTHRRLSG
jgi:hypothetical protein